MTIYNYYFYFNKKIILVAIHFVLAFFKKYNASINFWQCPYC